MKLSFFFLWCFTLVFAVPLSSYAALDNLPGNPDNLVARGMLVCLNKDWKEMGCVDQNNAFGLRTANGQLYPLKMDKSAETLNEEKRLQTREFQLTLRKVNDSNFYEIIKSQFFRSGKLYDFYYYCDVCHITTYTPGLCMCCRQETEYHERLAE